MPAIRTKSDVPVSTLVVDDEPLARSLLAALVRRDDSLRLVGECSNGTEAVEAVGRLRPDLVFLDIQMPVMDGIETVRTLLINEHVPYVIFVTAFDDYAVQAFEIDALDYLVKPIEKERFRRSVARARKVIRERDIVTLTSRLLDIGRPGAAGDCNAVQELTLRSGDSIVQISTDDVTWIEAANQYCYVHTANCRYTVSESLGQYAKRITDPRFFRIHRSVLVNAAVVVDVRRRRNGTHRVEIATGESLVLARSRASMVPGLLRTARTWGRNDRAR